MSVNGRIFTVSVSLLLLFAGNIHASDVNVLEYAEKTGVEVYYNPLNATGALEKEGHFISFSTAGGIPSVKDEGEFLDGVNPRLEGSILLAGQKYLDNAQDFFNVEETGNPYRIGAILIDPGHGGKDPGASATHKIKGKNIKVVEKDVNLSVGLKLYDRLRKAYPSKKILMTRSTDVFLSLSQRTEIANSVKLGENEAILYVSIHVNASLDKTASGYEVWYLSPGYRRSVIDSKTVEGDQSLIPILNSMMEEEYTTESILIAKFILDGIASQVGKLSSSRGIKAEEWFVVRNAKMPSVLIETGFLTNPEEAALLADDEYLKKLSLGMYNGLEAFVEHFERSRGFTGVK